MFLSNIKKRLAEVEEASKKSLDMIDKLTAENIDMNKQLKETSKKLTTFDESLQILDNQIEELMKSCNTLTSKIEALDNEFSEKYNNLLEDYNHTKRIVVYKRKKYQDKLTTEG